jgi:hypothetical protein
MEQPEMVSREQVVSAGETEETRRTTGVSPAGGGAGKRVRCAHPELPAKAREQTRRWKVTLITRRSTSSAAFQHAFAQPCSERLRDPGRALLQIRKTSLGAG